MALNRHLAYAQTDSRQKKLPNSSKRFRFEIQIRAMKKITFLLALALSTGTYAQNDKNAASPKIQKGFGVTVAQIQPQFPGGEDSLHSFLYQNLVYPEIARLNHTKGRVYVGFLVERTGKVLNPRVLSSATEELDNEALRVVSLMPVWIPGTKGGTPVDVQYILPIDFITPPLIQKKND